MPYYYHYYYYTAKGFSCQTEKNIIHIRRIRVFHSPHISMVILRNRTIIIIIYTELNMLHGFRRLTTLRNSTKVSYIIIQNKLWNQGQSKYVEFKCFGYISTWYLARWSFSKRFIHLIIRHITEWCKSFSMSNTWETIFYLWKILVTIFLY
jgi:hypothetical protein